RRHAEPLVVPVRGADVLLADADGELGDVVDGPVQQVIVREAEDDVRLRRFEAPAHLVQRLLREELLLHGRAIEPPGEAGRVRHGHRGDDLRHQRPSRSSLSARTSARADSSGYARLYASSAGWALEFA